MALASALRGRRAVSQITHGMKSESLHHDSLCSALSTTSAILSRLRRMSSNAKTDTTAKRSLRKVSWLPDDDKTFHQFLPHYRPRVRQSSRAPLAALSVEAAERSEPSRSADLARRSFHIETRGCQMNVADSEVVRALLVEAGYTETGIGDAFIVLINTCAIREKVRLKRKRLFIGD